MAGLTFSCIAHRPIDIPTSVCYNFLAVLQISRGGAAAARVAHNHEVAGSSPAPATISTLTSKQRSFLFQSRVQYLCSKVIKGITTVGILQKNQNGFSAVEGLLILVVLGIIGFTGWYVWQAKDKTDKALTVSNSDTPKFKHKSVSTPSKEEAKPDETTNWLLYKSSGGEYQIRLADGWELMRHVESTSLTSYKALEYKAGVKATVTEHSSGRGGPFPLIIMVSKQPTEIRGGLQGEFKTNSGLVGKKYMFIQQSQEGGHDLQYGEREYTYHFSKNGTYVYINHSVIGEQKDNSEYVEKVVKTLVIN